MIVDFSGEVFSSFRVHEDGRPLDQNSFRIGVALWNRVSEWQDEYSTFVTMNIEELNPNIEKVKMLEIKAVKILTDVAAIVFKIDDSINMIQYFSLCFDMYLCRITQEGKTTFYEQWVYPEPQ